MNLDSFPKCSKPTGSNPGRAVTIYILDINNYIIAIHTKAKIRKLGSLSSIVIHKDNIKKKMTLEEFFGKGKGRIKNTQKEKDETRKLWKMD